MDRSQPQRSGSGGGVDRLSKLEDHVLGHILSFLPAKEAARAALLSPRWRDVFAGVHTVSMEEPESPPIDDDRLWRSTHCTYCGPQPDPDGPRSFTATVAAALLGRHRRGGAVPLRALRVAMEGYRGKDAATLDQCVSYAVQQAGPALDVGLRFWYRLQVCIRPYALEDEDDQLGLQGIRIPVQSPIQNADNAVPDSDEEESRLPLRSAVSDMGSDAEDGSFVASEDEERAVQDRDGWPGMPAVYMVPRVLFSCATLRSLSLRSCLLAPPGTVCLPSLEILLLSCVHNEVQRLITGCPRLADLTIEACEVGTALSVLDGPRLRRLALQCCHELASFAVDASELQAFEYRGAVPDSSLLTLQGGTQKIKYCKIDICGMEVTSKEELTNFRELLQLFANAQHLHLESARLGSGIDKDVFLTFPAWPRRLC